MAAARRAGSKMPVARHRVMPSLGTHVGGHSDLEYELIGCILFCLTFQLIYGYVETDDDNDDVQTEPSI